MAQKIVSYSGEVLKPYTGGGSSEGSSGYSGEQKIVSYSGETLSPYSSGSSLYKYAESLEQDTNQFIRMANRDNSGDRHFNAAEYFEERKKQADTLKLRAADLSRQMETDVNYNPESYQPLIDYLSNFDTMVDDVLSSYKPSLDAREGMRAYEDEFIAAQERNEQLRGLDRSADFAFDPGSPAANIMAMFRKKQYDEGDRGIKDNWSDEQRYRLGLMQMEDPTGAKQYAKDINAGQDPYMLYEQQEQQKADWRAMDLNAERREIDRLKAELDDYYWNYNYDATATNARNAFDQEIKRREKEISDREQQYNLAKREQESAQFASAATRNDFKAKSGYVDSGFVVPTFVEDADPDELVYEYINNQSVRSQINQQTNTLAAKGYDLLTPEEVGIYNYYYATEGAGKAQQYLDNIQDTLNQRIGERGAAAKQGELWKQLMAAGISGYSNAVTSPQYFFNKKDDYINTSPFQYMSAAIREDLADTGKHPFFDTSLGQVGYDLINTTANMAPSMLLSAGTGALGTAIAGAAGSIPVIGSAAGAMLPKLGAAVGSATMGLSAAGGAYQQALNSGYTKEQARTYAALSGASEVALEYLLGGISKLGGEIPQKVISDMVSGIDNAIGRAAVQIGGNMASEGFEEGLQEVITPWIENLTLYADKNVDWNEVAYSTLLGALSGGVMEAPGVIKSETQIEKINNQLINLGAKGNTREMAELIAKYKNQEVLSDKELIKLVNSEPAMEIIRGKRNSSNESATVIEDAEVPKTAQPQVSMDGRAVQISTKKPVDVLDFASMDNGVATVQLNDGETAAYDDIAFKDQQQANQFYAVRSLPGLDTESANNLLHTIQDADAGKDIDSVVGIREAYAMGYYNQSESDLAKGDAAALTPELRKAVFDIGRQQNQVQEKIQPKAKAVTAKPTQGYKKITIEGKITKLDKKRKAEMAYVDSIADNFAGTAVHVYESYVGADGKRYFRDNNGVKHKAPNGKYINGEIWLDINSGDNGEGMMLNTFAHEMYHHIEKFNKEKANELASFVSRELGIENVEVAVQDQITKARAAGYGEDYFKKQGMTDIQATNEVYARAMSDFVADSLETMFTRGNPAEAISKLKTENRGLFDEIKSFIDKWVSKLKKFYQDETISMEGEMVSQLKTFEELQQLFMEAMQGAGENYRAALENAEPAVEPEFGDLTEAFSLRNTDTEQFKKWFAESKVVNPDGSPKVMYHGTSSYGFSIFNTYGGKFGLFGRGSYFTDNADVAESYTKKGKGQTPGVYDVYLSIQNPIDMDAAANINEWERAFDSNDLDATYLNGIATNEDAFRALKENLQDEGYTRSEAEDLVTDLIEGMGYDGITHIGGGRYGTKDGPKHRVYIAFDPEQIKSASKNKGTYDPEHANIYYSLRNEKPLTDREILAQIDPSKRNETERYFLGQYQDRLKEISEQEPRLEAIKEQMESLDPKKDKAKLTELRIEAGKIQRNVTYLKKKVRESEGFDMFKRMAKEERNNRSVQKYKEEQKQKIKAMQEEHRVLRNELTGTTKMVNSMEDEFIKLAKDYEAKKIDLKTMEEKYLDAGKQYSKDTEMWDREFSRLMNLYDDLSAKYSKDAGDAKKKIKRLEDTILRQRQTAKERVAGRRNTEMRHKIQKKVNELDQLLRHGSKHRNVPEFLQDSVAAVLQAINMEVRDSDQRRKTYEATIARYDRQIELATDPLVKEALIEKRDNYAAKGDQFANRMDTLKKAYEQIRKENTDLELDEGIAEHLNSLFETVGDTPLGQMTAEQLDAVNDILNVTMATVRNANEMLAEARSAGVVESSKSAIMEIRTIGGGAKKRTEVREEIEKFGWNNLKPVQAFEAIGSSVLNHLFKNLRSGEDTLAVDLQEGKNFFKNQWKKHNGDSWDTEKKWKFTSTSGKSFELDLNQIMSLYALAKRDQARDHLRVGGFTFDSQYKVKDEVKFGPVKIKAEVKNTDASAYNLSDEILGEIIGKLTADQRAFVDSMQDYLSDNMAAKGNEISLKKYGIRLFKDKNYFPLRVADQYMAKVREQQSGDRKLKNSGFTQAVTPNAKNPVVLSSFLEVWAEHVDEMSLYHSFVLPLDDLSRVLNYHDAYTEETAAGSVMEAIKTAYGEAAVNYIDNLIRDVNGGNRSDSAANFVNKWMSKAKKAQTMASLSVAIQQPSSILRAMSMINSSYFFGAKVTEKTHDRTWDEIKEYAPIAIIKEMGGYDTHVGKNTVDYLTDSTDYHGFGEKFKAFFTDGDFRDDAFGKLPELMDEMAWGVIWNAVKREQATKHPDVDVKSKAFMSLVADRFTDVITHTQVYDSVFSRSGLMRSKDGLVKMGTSFMAEPTTTANMLAMAVIRAKRGEISKAQAGRTVAAIAASLALNAALVSVVYALRDDDEDKRYDEKWLENFRNNFFESLNPAGYIPFIRDIDSMRKGFDIERTDMTLIGDLMNAIQGLENEDVTAWDKTLTVIGAVGDVLGVPMKNIIRDVRGIVQTAGFAWDDKPNPRTKTGAYMARRGMDLNNGEEMILALQRGDMEHIQRVFGRYESQEKAESALQSAIGEKYRAGEMSAEEATQLLTDNFDREDEHEVYWLFDKWDYAKENGNSEGWTKYGKFFEGVENGDFQSEMERLLEHGAEASDIQSQITRTYRKKYLENPDDRDEIREKLQTVYKATGMYEDEILEKFKDWDFEAEYGMTYSNFKAEYREGNVTEAELRSAMDFYGLLNYEIEEGIRGLNEEIKFFNKYGMSISEMRDAYDNGDISENQLINALVFTGKTRTEAREEVNERNIEKKYGIGYAKLDDAYKYNDISRSEFYNAMREHGATQQEADEAILGYDWLKKNVRKYPDLAIGDAKRFVIKVSDKMEERTLTDYGVSIDAYLKYKEGAKDCPGVDADGDGQIDAYSKAKQLFAMIDKLPISDEAKDGLALITNAKSTLRKYAPWHKK